ncbi:MAG: hybrid sensor histidine kinase/response regulator [Magnetococcales bacterium]|nr:hybrid sensor histidine kinase/response regulator [Magnetococcales bacterium]
MTARSPEPDTQASEKPQSPGNQGDEISGIDGRRVLIVDDMPINLRALSDTLKSHFEIQVATNGPKALQIATSSKPPDLILLDIMMPQMDGYEVCRKLKENPATREIPVIFITARNQEEDELQGLQLGAVDFITKPIRPAIVQARTRTHLALRAQQTKLEEKSQKLAQLNEIKNRFLGMAAHDLKNPLATIRGFSELMLEVDDLTQEDRQTFLETIHRVSNQMLNLVTDLLDVSVIESGRFTLEPKPGDLSALLDFRIHLLTLAAEKKEITLERELPKLPLIPFDAERLSQVVDNLLTNAIKFSKPGTQIRISASHRPPWVDFSVSDQGPGIPPQEREKLFKPFQKLSIKSTAGEKSTGLGLAIVLKIIDAHGGYVEVDSEVNKGTTFTVSLPALETS